MKERGTNNQNAEARKEKNNNTASDICLTVCDEVEDYITEFKRENEGEHEVVSPKCSKDNKESQETISINIYDEEVEEENTGKSENK